MSLTSKKVQGRPAKPLSVEETAEKVRALREKQSMWMKERESEKLSLAKTRKDTKNSSGNFSSGLSSANSKASGRSSSRSLSSSESRSGEDRNQYSNPRRKPLYPEPKRDNSDMISWIAKGPAPFSRHKRPPSGSGHHSRQNSTSRTLSREGNRSVSDRNAYATSKEYKASNYSIQRKSTAFGVQSQEIHSELGPSQGFYSPGEEKAKDTTYQVEGVPKKNGQEETSLHKPVKNDLASQLDAVKLHGTQFPPEMLAALTDTLAQRLQGAVQPKQDSVVPEKSQRHGAEHGMSSHYCCLCDELMAAPRHTPTAVIPCGHSFCKACLRDCRKCPTCQTKVNSTAVNTVLQAIIEDFNAQKEKERLQQLEEQTRKYVDEYQSLCMRHTALTAEAESILQIMESVTEVLVEQKKKVRTLGMDKQSLREKIKELQEHLNKLTLEEENCQGRCEELELNYNEQKDRLAMAEDTIKMINKSKERVKMLVQNFAPSLNLDEMFKE